MTIAVMRKGEPMDNLISRLSELRSQYSCFDENERGAYHTLSEAIKVLQEQKTGEWTEKHHAYSDEESVIEEWQSCCCSVCGHYDTRPYMYYFDEPNYCSYCGAKMECKEE